MPGVHEAHDNPQSADCLSRLDMRDTAVLKGLALSAIVFHNFFHAVSPAHQNEFRFHEGGFARFLETARHAPLAIQAFFSFFGHFGVQIFLFLAAYGMAKSHWDDDASWGQFMWGRIRKYYPTFGLVVVPWAVAVALEMGPLAFLRTLGAQIALMFVGLSPFMPNRGLPPVGPWWFIAYIVEFWAMWFVLRRFTVRFGWKGLLALSIGCVVITAAVNPLLVHWTINLMTTPIGRMSCICFGIAAARYPMRIQAPLAVTGFAVMLAGSAYRAIWPLTSISFLLGALWVYMQLRPWLRNSRMLENVGRYSVLIFLLNGIVREWFLPLATTPARQLVFGLASAVASFSIAAAMQQFLVHMQRRAVLRQAMSGVSASVNRRSQSESAASEPLLFPE